MALSQDIEELLEQGVSMAFAQLMQQSRDGCRSSRDKLLSQASSYVLVRCRRELFGKVRSKVDALDVAQDVMLDVHRQLERFVGTTEAEFMAWTGRVTRGHIARVHRTYLGTQIRDLKREQSSVDFALFVAEDISVVDGAIHTEELVSLATAMSRLADDYREVVALRLENHSFAEIGSRMNRSVDSVQKLWARGLVKLRVMMC